ncbi:MAG: hypothetical protein WBM13_11960 [Bacteroidia bacterium]
MKKYPILEQVVAELQPFNINGFEGYFRKKGINIKFSSVGASIFIKETPNNKKAS